MDKRNEIKWRMRHLRLRAAIFFKRNGLFVAAIACLAVLGLAAALIFSGVGGDRTPVNRSDDERLSDAERSTPLPTVPAHTAVPLPSLVPLVTEPPTVPTVPPVPAQTPIPDFTAAPTEEAGTVSSQLQPPVDGNIIRVFAVDSLIYSETLQQWMTHPGVDIAANKGDPVYAVLGGVVSEVYTDDMLGVTVVIAHANGMESVYSGLKDEPPVAVGDTVASRQIVGYIGDTAIGECAERSHLHFEIRYAGDPIDPRSLIVFNKD